MSKLTMPPCVGEYEDGNLTCNGNPDGVDAKDKSPCAWKARCAAFTAYLTAHKEKPEDYLAYGEKNGQPYAESDQEFVDMLQQMADGKSVVAVEQPGEALDGMAAELNADGSDDGDKTKRRHETKHFKKKLALALELYEHFQSRLVEELGTKTRFAPADVPALPGELITVNRMFTSNYIGVYCRSTKGHDKPVAQLHYKTRSNTIDILFPIEVGVIPTTLDSIKKLNLIPFDDGLASSKFKSKAVKLDKEGLAHAAKAIAKMIKQGIIELPTA